MRGPFRPAGARWWAPALLLLCAAGCAPRTATVSGVVTYKGRPLPGGSVVLYCPDNQIVRGLIGPDGRYSIPDVPIGPVAATVTVQSHTRVPEGFRYKQQLPASQGGPVPPTPDADDTRRVPLPSRYALPEESGLTVVVGTPDVTYDIELHP